MPAAYVVCDEWPVYGPRLDGWLALFAGAVGRRVGAVAGRLTGLPTRLVEPRRATYCWLSRFVRDTVLEATAWRPAHETVTYSGIDTGDFPLADSRAGTDAGEPWRWRLLCVGRVEPRKGFATAVAALAQLPDAATLTIVGPDDGTHAAELLAQATRAGVADRLSFAVADRRDIAAHYRAADALLFTSAWAEPFGLVPVEAMACGTPVVAAATGGAREFLDDGANCLVVPAGDADGLAATVRRLAADPQLRSRLVRGGLATAADLTVDTLADVLEQWHLAAAIGFRDGEPPHRPPPAAGPS